MRTQNYLQLKTNKLRANFEKNEWGNLFGGRGLLPGATAMQSVQVTAGWPGMEPVSREGERGVPSNGLDALLEVDFRDLKDPPKRKVGDGEHREPSGVAPRSYVDELLAEGRRRQGHHEGDGRAQPPAKVHRFGEEQSDLQRALEKSMLEEMARQNDELKRRHEDAMRQNEKLRQELMKSKEPTGPREPKWIPLTPLAPPPTARRTRRGGTQIPPNTPPPALPNLPEWPLGPPRNLEQEGWGGDGFFCRDSEVPRPPPPRMAGEAHEQGFGLPGGQGHHQVQGQRDGGRAQNGEQFWTPQDGQQEGGGKQETRDEEIARLHREIHELRRRAAWHETYGEKWSQPAVTQPPPGLPTQQPDVMQQLVEVLKNNEIGASTEKPPDQEDDKEETLREAPVVLPKLASITAADASCWK